MDYTVYKLIHYVGIFTLMFSLGSLFTKYNKAAVMGHGIALFLILLGGFGMQAKMKAAYVAQFDSGFPNWMIAKFAIWLIFGAAIVLAKRDILKGATAWLVMIGLAFAAAYLGFMKPF
jgi:hypothetical protein